MNIICFHNPNEENGYLSNWYPAHFTVEGIEFSSMEQFMMYQKACRFHDASVAKEILSTNDVAEIKKLGREVHGYDENTWTGKRCSRGGYWVTPFLGKERKTGCPWRVRSWRKAGGRKNGKW